MNKTIIYRDHTGQIINVINGEYSSIQYFYCRVNNYLVLYKEEKFYIHTLNLENSKKFKSNEVDFWDLLTILTCDDITFVALLAKKDSED